MVVLRAVVGAVSVLTAFGVLMSVLRSVVLPRGVPARLTRVSFLAVRGALSLRLWITRSTDFATRDRVLALQAPLGIFGQLFVWAALLFLCFAGLFWASDPNSGGAPVQRSLELAGSSMLTLGTDAPHGLGRQFIGFVAAGVGLTLLALVVTYLPSLYGAFSRREAVVSKLVVRTGAPPSGVRLLVRTWELDRFDDLDEVWNGWEDWFVELGESHVSYPQLAFFRSTNPSNHWLLATEAVLDGALLLRTTCDVEPGSRSELCIDAGVQSLTAIGEFLGVPAPEPGRDPEIALPRAVFEQGREALAQAGVAIVADADEAWLGFRRGRARYESLLATLGRLTDAPLSEWSPWTSDTPRHRPPLLRIHQR